MNKTTVKFLLMLVGLVIFLTAYFLVYMDFTEQTEALEAESKTLSEQLSTLEGYYTQLDDYEAGIEGSKTEITDKLSGYYSMKRRKILLCWLQR